MAENVCDGCADDPCQWSPGSVAAGYCLRPTGPDKEPETPSPFPSISMLDQMNKLQVESIARAWWRYSNQLERERDALKMQWDALVANKEATDEVVKVKVGRLEAERDELKSQVMDMAFKLAGSRESERLLGEQVSVFASELAKERRKHPDRIPCPICGADSCSLDGISRQCSNEHIFERPATAPQYGNSRIHPGERIKPVPSPAPTGRPNWSPEWGKDLAAPAPATVPQDAQHDTWAQQAAPAPATQQPPTCCGANMVPARGGWRCPQCDGREPAPAPASGQQAQPRCPLGRSLCHAEDCLHYTPDVRDDPCDLRWQPPRPAPASGQALCEHGWSRKDCHACNPYASAVLPKPASGQPAQPPPSYAWRCHCGTLNEKAWMVCAGCGDVQPGWGAVSEQPREGGDPQEHEPPPGPIEKGEAPTPEEMREGGR